MIPQAPALPREIGWWEQQVLVAMGVCPHCGRRVDTHPDLWHLSTFGAHFISQRHCGCLEELEMAHHKFRAERREHGLNL